MIICVIIVVVHHNALLISLKLLITYSLAIYILLKDSEGLSEAEKDLKNLKEELIDDFPVGPLIRKCCTLDQVEIFCWHVMSYQFGVL